MAFVFDMDPERKRLAVSVMVAFALEAVVLGGGYHLLTEPAAPTPPPTPKPLFVTMVPAPTAAPVPVPTPLPAPAPATPEKATPPKQTRKVAPKPPARVLAPPPVHSMAPPPVVTPAAPDVPRAVPTLPATASANASAAPAPQKASPAQAEPTPAQKASFEGKMRAAIQSALKYPESARMAGMTGQTKVAFTFRDGQVSAISVVTSSGMDLLDRAAVAAVQSAHYPLPDSTQAGKTLREQLWVTFTLDDSE